MGALVHINRPNNTDLYSWIGGALTQLEQIAIAQIKFPAVQVPSSDANTLDDYEEGSWTPIVGSSGNQDDVTYTTQVGRYIKIGKQVFAQAFVAISSVGTLTGDVQLKGLPFTSENTTSVFSILPINWDNLSASEVIVQGRVNVNSNLISVRANTAAATSVNLMPVSALSASTVFTYTAIYRAAA